ncbi:hypothetical protein JTB14_001188 [Gonioctena quinquepunctata]|nr:hypothetical protein JTB14_001188 [Gonioctena quinquepunctata]
MSGQWEVVGKKKERGSKLPIPKANKETQNGKNPANGLNIKDVFIVPNLQAKGSSGISEIKKNSSGNKAREVRKNARKEKPQEKTKPKTIESALNSIDEEEFLSLFEKTKIQFPDAPIVWLKELVYFFNQKLSLDIQDVLFSTKPQGYPLSMVPSDIKTVLEKSTNEAGKNNTQLFFDICLSSMATDMAKGLPALGYKLFLQFIALKEPKFVAENLSKHVVLRNSYQNRPNIGLSILWAVGHVGYSDFNSGLLVFKELFLPLLDMKSYSRFGLNYLLILITSNKDVTITKEDFLWLVDIIYSTKKTLPSDLLHTLTSEVPRLKQLLLDNNKERYNNYIEILLKQIVSHNSELYRKCLCDVLLEIFFKDQTNLASWIKVYNKTVVASAILLEHMNDNWKIVSKQLNKGTLTDLLNSFKSANDDLNLKKRKEDGLKASIVAIQKIDEKMATKRKSGFPMKTTLLFITLAIAGLVYYDIKLHGTWNDSITHKTLKDYHVCEYTHLAINKTKKGLYWMDDRIEENFPDYHKTVVDVSEPYVVLLVNVGKLSRNVFLHMKEVVIEQYPIVLQSIESNIPGLIEQSQNTASNIYSTSVLYFNRGVDYLKEEVFIGQLSPENVQRVVIEALNTTQQKALECYHWIYEKVQTTIK